MTNRIAKEYKIGDGLYLETFDNACHLRYYPDDQIIVILFEEELDNLISVLQIIKAHNKNAEQEKVDQEKLTLWNNNIL